MTTVEIPIYRLEAARLLAVQIADKIRHGRPSPVTRLITVNIHPDAATTMDDIVDVIEEKIGR